MEQSPSWEAKSHSESQEIPAFVQSEISLPCSQKPAHDCSKAALIILIF
jgi:hypothetical protein